MSRQDRMLKAVAEYLESVGWHALVISADRVQGPVDAHCNYELVFRFTGKSKVLADATTVSAASRAKASRNGKARPAARVRNV